MPNILAVSGNLQRSQIFFSLLLFLLLPHLIRIYVGDHAIRITFIIILRRLCETESRERGPACKMQIGRLTQSAVGVFVVFFLCLRIKKLVVFFVDVGEEEDRNKKWLHLSVIDFRCVVEMCYYIIVG